MRIRILIGDRQLSATLDDSTTAEAVSAALPLRGRVSRWGDEVYFIIPVQIAEAADARQDMGIGELGYWPVGHAFCLFFGPTPVSRGETPRAYSNVNPFGSVDGDEQAIKKALAGICDGDDIEVVAAD
jgi:hypothetical protein